MNKIWKLHFIRFVCVLLIAICSLGLFEITTDQDEEVLRLSTDRLHMLEIAMVSDEEPVPEVVVETTPVVEESPSIPVVEETQDTYYAPEPVPYNSIQVGNALSNRLMKDYTGDHFYLNHNLNGDYDGIGVPYIDFRTDFTTKKTIIYAHSSTNGNGPFQALQNYHNNKWFYDQNPYITIQYEGNTYTYQIFSVYVSVADSEESEGLEYFHHIYYTDQEWQETLNRYKSHSEYDTGVSVSSSDRIIILQTCSMDPNFYQKYYRYNLLIMGKLI